MKYFVHTIFLILLAGSSVLHSEEGVREVVLRSDVLAYYHPCANDYDLYIQKAGEVIRKEEGKFLGLYSLFYPWGGNTETVMSVAKQIKPDGLYLDFPGFDSLGEFYNRKSEYFELLSGCSWLTDIKISLNNIDRKILSPISALENLEYLTLHAESIKFSGEDVFLDHMLKLKEFELKASEDINIPASLFRNNKNLLSLRLESHKRACLSFEFLKYLTGLKRIQLTCRDSDIESVIRHLPDGIEEIGISFMATGSSDMSEHLTLLSRFKSLQSLSLLERGDAIRHKMFLSSLPELPPSLKSLAISVESCNGEKTAAIGKLSDLQNLRLDGRMEIDGSIEWLCGMGNLKSVYFSNATVSNNLISVANSLPEPVSISLSCRIDEWDKEKISEISAFNRLKTLELIGTFPGDALTTIGATKTIEILSVNIIEIEAMNGQKDKSKWKLTPESLSSISNCVNLRELHLFSFEELGIFDIFNRYDEAWSEITKLPNLKVLTIIGFPFTTQSTNYMKGLDRLYIHFYDAWFFGPDYSKIDMVITCKNCNILKSYVILWYILNHWELSKIKTVRGNAGKYIKVNCFNQDDHTYYIAYTDEKQRRFIMMLPDAEFVNRIKEIKVEDVDFDKDGEEPRIAGGFLYAGTDEAMQFFW